MTTLTPVHALDATALRVLCHVCREMDAGEPTTTGGIQESLGLDAATALLALDRLEAEGLIGYAPKCRVMRPGRDRLADAAGGGNT